MGTGQGEDTKEMKSSDSGEGGPNSTHGDSKGDEQEEEAEDENVAEGLEAEEGDFVNVEVAFAYRARTTGAKDLTKKSKNAHLFLAFYLPGNIRFRKSSIHSYCVIVQFSSRLYEHLPSQLLLCMIVIAGLPKHKHRRGRGCCSLIITLPNHFVRRPSLATKLTDCSCLGRAPGHCRYASYAPAVDTGSAFYRTLYPHSLGPAQDRPVLCASYKAWA